MEQAQQVENRQEGLISKVVYDRMANMEDPLKKTAELLGIGKETSEPTNKDDSDKNDFEVVDNDDKAKKLVEDLKKNHVKIEENAEMLGYEGKRIYVDLPAVGDFKGYKFDCFISNESYKTGRVGGDVKDNSFTQNELLEYRDAIREYVNACGIKMEENESYLYANNTLMNITGLNQCYWLNDDKFRFDCTKYHNKISCEFSDDRVRGINNGYLLLKSEKASN